MVVRGGHPPVAPTVGEAAVGVVKVQVGGHESDPPEMVAIPSSLISLKGDLLFKIHLFVIKMSVTPNMFMKLETTHNHQLTICIIFLTNHMAVILFNKI